MKWFVLLFSASSSLFASSVFLVNDSAFKLRAVVQGSDGAFLGEVILQPHQSTTWTDSYGQYGRVNPQPNYSVTPYLVKWYCVEGSAFSYCDVIASGGTATARTCMGTRMCPPPKKQPPGTNPPNPESYLHQSPSLQQQEEESSEQD